MSDQAKERHGVLLTVIDMIGEEIEEHESCPVCSNVLTKLRKALLQEGETIIEATREQYGLV